MSSMETINLITVDPEKCNIFEAQDKGLHDDVFMNMIEILKEQWISPLKKIYEKANKQLKEIIKQIQDTDV